MEPVFRGFLLYISLLLTQIFAAVCVIAMMFVVMMNHNDVVELVFFGAFTLSIDTIFYVMRIASDALLVCVAVALITVLSLWRSR